MNTKLYTIASLLCIAQITYCDHINIMPDIGFSRLNANFVKALIAYETNQGFLPKKNCEHTGSRTIPFKTPDIGESQEQRVDELLSHDIPLESIRSDFIKWLCAQTDTASTIFQRFLDLQSFDYIFTKQLCKGVDVRTLSKRTYLDSAFAAYHGRMPTETESNLLQASKKEQQALLKKLETCVNTVFKTYKKHKAAAVESSVSPEKLGAFLNMLSTKSSDEIHALLQQAHD